MKLNNNRRWLILKESFEMSKILAIGGVATVIGIFVGSRTGGTYIFEIGNNLCLVSILAAFLAFMVKIGERE